MPEHQAHRDLRGLTVEQAMRTDLPVARLAAPFGKPPVSSKAAPRASSPSLTRQAGCRVSWDGTSCDSAGTTLTSIADVMRRDTTTVFPDQSLDLALLKLGRHSVRQAPVVTRAVPALVLGMLSLEDISAAVERSHS